MSDPKQDKDLLEKLNSAMISLWNSGVDMDAVAEDCKFNKGESLYDRIAKCESSVKEWERDLDELKRAMAALKTALDGYKVKNSNEPADLAQVSYQIAEKQQDSMRASLKKTRQELDQHKATLRKVKT